MDWARDFNGISDRDYQKVFRYEEKPTTVVQMTTGDKEPKILSLESEADWSSWLCSAERPINDGSKSGYVLIIAKRPGQPRFSPPSRVSAGQWLEKIRNDTLSASWNQALVETLDPDASAQVPSGASGRRGLRTLPFTQDVFRLIVKSLYIHGSVSRVISRADVQTLSCSEVHMGNAMGEPQTAEIYNCRTSNAWEMDLALTATHFPRCQLTFAIMFGCPLDIEEEIISRLSFATAEAAHPLLIPGIFIELERSRHVRVVETMIDELENKVFELDFHAEQTERAQTLESERRSREKRTAFLDTAYLRNALIGWTTQLAKMLQEVDNLKDKSFVATSPDSIPTRSHNERFPGEDVETESILSCFEGEDEETSTDSSVLAEKEDVPKVMMQKASRRIKERIQAIIDEYEDKIRDCTMRVDGMAMATQWTQGEIAVEIALAAARDSRHMRSIALLTMVFLPGTFFASVFSMTFFNWSGSDGEAEAEVSGYIWIYVLVTVSCTLLTVGTWYYFVIWRQSRSSTQVKEDGHQLM